jgi:hypothetical protein
MARRRLAAQHVVRILHAVTADLTAQTASSIVPVPGKGHGGVALDFATEIDVSTRQLTPRHRARESISAAADTDAPGDHSAGSAYWILTE